MESSDPQEEASQGVTSEVALKQAVLAMARLLLPPLEQQKPEVAALMSELASQMPTGTELPDTDGF